MSNQKKWFRIGIIALVIVLAVALFFGGIALTKRYQSTIVNTYDKYYNKYHNQIEDYIRKGEDEISKNIEIASREGSKK